MPPLVVPAWKQNTSGRDSSIICKLSSMSNASPTVTCPISFASLSISTSFSNVMPLFVSTLYRFESLST